jgi:hypothetical protein
MSKSVGRLAIAAFVVLVARAALAAVPSGAAVAIAGIPSSEARRPLLARLDVGAPDVGPTIVECGSAAMQTSLEPRLFATGIAPGLWPQPCPWLELRPSQIGTGMNRAPSESHKDDYPSLPSRTE